MDNELLRNGSGYVDFTAYMAIKNYVQDGEAKMEYKRGEIFEYSANGYDTKKALVVSADFRKDGRFISVIVLSDEIKGENMVPVVCGGQMYADCGMVSFATNDRLGNYLRTASKAEMELVDEGIAKCLGIEPKIIEKPVEVSVDNTEKIEEFKRQLKEQQLVPVQSDSTKMAALKAELNVYRGLYENLLAKVIS